MKANLTVEEHLELLTLSTLLLPNMDSRDYDVDAAVQRQLELFKKAAQPYSRWQEAEVLEDSNSD